MKQRKDEIILILYFPFIFLRDTDALSSFLLLGRTGTDGRNDEEKAQLQKK